jgi:hypothetical protein
MTSIDASQAGANAEVQPGDRPPLIDGATDYTSLTDSVCRIPEWEKTPKAWYVAFTFSLMLLGILGAMIGYLIFTGVGVWGNNSRSSGAGRSSTSCSGSVSATRGR